MKKNKIIVYIFAIMLCGCADTQNSLQNIGESISNLSNSAKTISKSVNDVSSSVQNITK